jgi:2-polyprenyl-3-methyl-5-hydroxy-6-metoxy-1,4-benzoquinol methylase
MPETIQICPLCGGLESSLFDRRSFHQQEVINRVCESCGLVYQSPRMNAAELDGFYQAEYRQLYQGSEDPIQKDLAVQYKRAEAALSFVRSRVEGVSRHLDIGSSAGLFLQSFQKAYGCQVYGVEPGTAYREYARKQGLAVAASLEELAVQGQGDFDLISMMHVLEHIPDPVIYLSQLRKKYLNRGGWLLLEVPNLYAHDSFETAHLFSFSSHTLEQVVKKAGFEVVAIRKHGLPRSKIIPLYLTLLARPAGIESEMQTFSVQPERYASTKRRLGMFYRRIITRLAPGKAWLSIDVINS